MKNIFNKLTLIGALALFLTSCKKDENRIEYLGGTNPTISANKTGSIPLSYLTKDDEAVTFSWTNPEYQFTTGISSQDVNYILEIDTAGTNFTSPNVKKVSISKDLSTAFTQSQFNDILLNQLVLVPGTTYNVEVRVTSSLVNNNAKLSSNALSFTATPYAIPPKVTPPGTAPDYLDGQLFMVGSATPGGWNNPVPVPSQQFTRVSATLYELTLPLVGGGSYLFLPLNGNWGFKFGCLGANNTNNPDGDDFKASGGDFAAPAAPGTYKITVDFQRGKFTVVKQ